jgi:hypothetical protein
MSALRHPPQIKAWATASFGHDADTLPVELSALGQHLGQCQGQRGRLFSLHCLAEATHGLLASRTMTTLVGVALMFAIASLAI